MSGDGFLGDLADRVRISEEPSFACAYPKRYFAIQPVNYQ